MERFLHYEFGRLIFGGAYTKRGLFVEFYGTICITKCHAGASHPSVSSPRLLYPGENFSPIRNLAMVSCKGERPHVSV